MKSNAAKELLKDAEALANGFTSEARRRSAVSRAYYAAYHRCLAWVSLLPNRPEPPKSGSVRVHADYELQKPVDQKVMNEQIKGVRETFATCAHTDT